MAPPLKARERLSGNIELAVNYMYIKERNIKERNMETNSITLQNKII
jgi:hypothetical protein